MKDELVEALVQIAREKDIEQEALAAIIEHALVTAYRKTFVGQSPDIRVQVDKDFREVHVYRRYTVVDDEVMDADEILLDDARRTHPDCKPGDTIEIELQEPMLARIAAQTARQVLVQKLKELERDRIYEEYKDRVDEVLAGIVVRREYGNVLVNIGKADAILPPAEQIPREPYRPNDRLKVLILSVDRDNRGARIIVSRRHPHLIRRLFELEVPEIADGVVIIKNVAREPGARSKIAVVSRDERVDPLGSCVGHRGSRVQAVVSELRDEKIDIIRWSPDPAKFIESALSPAKVSSVILNPYPTERSHQNPTALVVVPDSQLSLAIGKSGQNVRLAASLTGWHIDIRAESQMPRGQAPSSQSDASLGDPAGADTSQPTPGASP